jgi:hypothetical protein
MPYDSNAESPSVGSAGGGATLAVVQTGVTVEVTVKDEGFYRMIALAGERNALLREIVSRIATNEVQNARLIELEEERVGLLRQLLFDRQLTDTPPATAQLSLRAVGRTGVAKRRRA